MARGLSNEAVPYILERERGLESKEQSVFWIKPKKGHDANVTTQAYLRAFKERDNGERDLDVNAADQADVVNFKHVVKKIENFVFSDEYYGKHPAVKESAQPVDIFENGENVQVLAVPVIEREDLIADVCKELSSEDLRDITEASNKVSKLREGTKKS